MEHLGWVKSMEYNMTFVVIALTEGQDGAPWLGQIHGVQHDVCSYCSDERAYLFHGTNPAHP